MIMALAGACGLPASSDATDSSANELPGSIAAPTEETPPIPSPTPTPSASPTSSPIPTRDIDATVESRVRETVAAMPTEPQYLPTLEDFRVYAPVRTSDDDYGPYVATYVASECLAGRDLSFVGFGSFLNEINQTGKKLLNLTAELVISEIAAQPHGGECMRPFLNPQSGSDAVLAADLVLAVRWPYVGPFERFLPDIIRERSGRWFDPSIGKGQPYLTWLCESSERRCQIRNR